MSRAITVDFEGVESGSSYVRITEGDYAFKIAKVVLKKGKDSGNNYLLFDMRTIKGPSTGLNKTIPHSCSLTKQSLWNLRNLIEACGKTVPSKAVKLDLDKMIGWEFAGTVIDDEYEGKKKSTISSFFPLEDLVAVSSGGEDAPTGKATPKKAASKKEAEPEEEEAEQEEEGTEEEAEELFS
jgi:hypothetical protein